jgi:MEDS: MEthanogen/methylotroph, DcmR Sensory domain
MKQISKTVSIGRTLQSCPCHACAFFTSKEEEYRVMLPFMAEGFKAGDKLVHIIDKSHRDERVARLSQAGIDVETAEQNGQLELLPWEKAHLVDGCFDQHRMLAGFEKRFASDNERYEATRLWSNQEWALKDLPGVLDIIEYESRFNLIWPKYKDITVCVYDATKFSAEVMMGMMRTHPLVIVDSEARPNPFYVPPEELLKELRAHKPVRLNTL